MMPAPPDIPASSPPIEPRVSIEVPGSCLAQSLVLSTRLVLAATGKRASQLSPRIPGSILWEEKTVVRLEGAGPRFPIEFVSFPSDLRHAAWYVYATDDLEQPFLGGVRLYVNSENAAVARALTAVSPDAADRVVLSALYNDVGRQLVEMALQSEAFISRSAEANLFSEDSVGRALCSLLSNFLEGHLPTDLRDQFRSDPRRFAELLQDRFMLFEGITSAE